MPRGKVPPPHNYLLAANLGKITPQTAFKLPQCYIGRASRIPPFLEGRRVRCSSLAQLTSDAALADLPVHQGQVGPSTPVHQVAEEFERRPDLPGVLVCDDSTLLGLISRPKFFQHLSRLAAGEANR